MQKDINILITGGAGYVGSHLVMFLLSKPFLKIFAIDNFSNSNPKFINSVKRKFKKKFLFKKIDIRDGKKLSNFFLENNINVVVHLAAKIDASESFEKRKEYRSINLDSTKKLINISISNDVKKFIFASSAAVYGEVTKGNCSEKKNTNPINPYGKYKLQAEKYIIQNQKKINFVILRFFNIAGINKFFYSFFYKRNSIFFTLVKFLVNDKKLFYINQSNSYTKDNSPVRDFIHVNDISKIIYNTILSKRSNFLVNCGIGIKVSVVKFIKTLEFVANIKINTKLRQPRIGDPTCVVSNPTLIKKTFKKLKYKNLNEILKDCFQMSLFFKKLKKQINEKKFN